MNVGELREYIKGLSTLPDDMPVQYVTKRGDVKEVEELVLSPYTQSLIFKEKKSR